MTEKKPGIQTLWGAVLVVTGICMFFAIPQKIDTIRQANQYSSATVVFLMFSFYLISVMLIAGGGKKLYDSTIKKSGSENDSET